MQASSDAPTRLPAAVLFDMDGTLVDTEPYWIAAEYAVVEEHGGTWSDAHAHAVVGFALLDAAAYIREHGPVDLEPAAIVELLLQRVIAATRERTPWRPGADRLLTELRGAGVPCAMVTMSYRELAEAVADQLPDGTFATLVTGDEVTRGKPDPEPYAVAAARLGVDPADCIAIEDSPTGVASAEAAGCVTIAIPHVVPVADAPGRIRRSSLVELDVAALSALLSGRR